MKSLTPITRRALGIEYASPSTCALPSEVASASGVGDDLSTIDFVETNRLAGPLLVVSVASETTLRLDWSAVTGAAFYRIYRSDSADGPFVFLQGPVGPRFYVDTPPAPGEYFYRVTAIEPNAGETDPSNIDSAILGAPIVPIVTPPVAGYKMWLAPESRIFEDEDGLIPQLVDNAEVRYWEDLSGFNLPVRFSADAALRCGSGPKKCVTLLNGLRQVQFGAAETSYSSPGQYARTGLITDGQLTATDGATIFLVATFLQTPSAQEPYGTAVGIASTSYLLRQQNVNKRWESYFLSGHEAIDGSGGAFVGNDSPQILAARFNDAANTQELFRGGTLVQTAPAVGTLPAGRICIGFREDNPIESHFHGTIAEVVIYDSVLSDLDVAAVNAYLATKYNL